MARRRSSSSSTNSGACRRCHRKNLSNGPALVFGNSLIKHRCAPAIKWVMAMASTNRTQRVGRYCNFRRRRNSWWLSENWLTSMVTFHWPHQVAKVLQNTAARKHTGSKCWICSSKKFRYVTWHWAAVALGPGMRGQLYSTLWSVDCGSHLCLRAHEQKLGWVATAGGG